VQLPDDDFGQTIFSPPKREPEPAVVSDLTHFVVVTKGEEPIARVELGATPVTVGREAGQAIVLADTQVSRRHARVSLVDGQPVIEDLGSTNGTFLDGQRLARPTPWNEGNPVRIGSHVLTHERRSRTDVQRSSALENDLRRASSYVSSLLPPPLTEGPVRAEWRFVPSAQLGGDAFGYFWLDPTTFVFYLVDVSGHGVGSAMHSVTVLNVLRQRALPGVSFGNPGEVLASLNNRFQMASHDGLFFTIWYGAYSTTDRRLRYASAGHHVSYLMSADRTQCEPLGSPALMIGAVADLDYDVADVTVAPGSSLYVFSDGIFEIVTAEGSRWSLDEFEPLLRQPPIPGVPEPERLLQAVKTAAGPRPFDDDASLMMLTFP
jgi:serine phosphatase RsbU (regulator of sigma subunit)